MDASLVWAGAAVLGLVIGSFLNVLIHRLPRMLEQQWAQEVGHWLAEHDGQPGPAQALLPRALDSGGEPPVYNLMRPRSHCPSCGHTLSWWENIPLLGFVILRGRCRHCARPIAWRYPALELLTAALFVACAWRWGATAAALTWAACGSVLLALACIDWDTQLLPDDLTQPLLWAGLIAAGLGLSATALSDALWGAVAGYLVLWLVYHAYRVLTGRHGMGQGDFKLLAALGAWLGWQALLPVVLLASMAGAAVGLGLRWSGRLAAGQPLAFGPYLVAAGLLLMLAPEPVGGWLWP